MKKLISVLLFLIMMSSFCGCEMNIGTSDNGNVADIPQPTFASTIDTPPDFDDVRLYFDNTKSMYGFVCEGDPKGRTSQFNLTVNALFDIIKGYPKHAFFTLGEKPATAGTTVKAWKEVSETDFANYKDKSFYLDSTYPTGGPLHDLKNSGHFDATKFNIILSDMTEQDMSNSGIINEIAETVGKKNGFSIAFFLVNSNFYGYVGASNPAGTKTDSTKDKPYAKTRPFCIIAVGPTDEIINFDKLLASGMKEAGIADNKSFYHTTIISNRIQPASPEKGLMADRFNFLDAEGKSLLCEFKNITPSCDVTNLNYNMVVTNPSDFFSGESSNNQLCYTYTGDCASNKGKNTAKLRFLLKLSDLADGACAADAEYTLDSYFFDGKNVNYCDVYAYQPPVTELDPEADETAVVTYPGGWEQMSDMSIFKGSYPLVELNEAFYKNNAYIPIFCDTENKMTEAGLSDEDAKKLDEQTAKELAKDIPFTLFPVETVDNDSGALVFTITLFDVKKLKEFGDRICFDIKVYGRENQTEAEASTQSAAPQWVRDFNCPADETGSDRYGKTVGLKDFYDTLSGQTSSVRERRENAENNKVVIANIPVTIDLSNYKK